MNIDSPEKAMKEIKAVIQPHMLSKVMRALHELPHFPGVTVTPVRGQGRGRGAGGAFKVTEDGIDYHNKVMLDVYCSPANAREIAEAIRKAAHTGLEGDGLIVVADVERVVRIRTGDTQDHAV
jgi:nitrogen regulatory protein P-II 1